MSMAARYLQILANAARDSLVQDVAFYEAEIRRITTGEGESAGWSSEYRRGCVDVLRFVIEMNRETISMFDDLPPRQRPRLVIDNTRD